MLLLSTFKQCTWKNIQKLREALFSPLTKNSWWQNSVKCCTVCWDLPVPRHYVTPIRRLWIWQVIGPNALTNIKKKQPCSASPAWISVWRVRKQNGVKSKELRRWGQEGQEEEGGRKRESWKGVKLWSMSVSQREILCQRPTLACHLTDLPDVGLREGSDMRADELLAERAHVRFKEVLSHPDV